MVEPSEGAVAGREYHWIRGTHRIPLGAYPVRRHHLCPVEFLASAPETPKAMALATIRVVECIGLACPAPAEPVSHPFSDRVGRIPAIISAAAPKRACRGATSRPGSFPVARREPRGPGPQLPVLGDFGHDNPADFYPRKDRRATGFSGTLIHEVTSTTHPSHRHRPYRYPQNNVDSMGCSTYPSQHHTIRCSGRPRIHALRLQQRSKFLRSQPCVLERYRPW